LPAVPSLTSTGVSRCSALFTDFLPRIDCAHYFSFRRKKMFYWLLLALAIVFEIVGTLAMKWASLNGHAAGYFFMLAMIALSYITLCFAVKKIALGVAYAIWEGVGVLCITLFSVMLFDEALPLMKVAGLATLVTGIALVKSGTISRKETSHAAA